MENININSLGFIIVGVFVATGILALLVLRVGRVQERWNAHLVEPTKGLG